MKEGIWFKSVALFFLIWNLFYTLKFTYKFYLAITEGGSSSSFEYIFALLHFLDVVAFYCLFRGNLSYLKLVLATSIIYTLVSWHFIGPQINNYISYWGANSFFLFVVKATVLPFLDVGILYVLGKYHITIRGKGTPQGSATSGAAGEINAKVKESKKIPVPLGIFGCIFLLLLLESALTNWELVLFIGSPIVFAVGLSSLYLAFKGTDYRFWYLLIGVPSISLPILFALFLWGLSQASWIH